MEDAPLVSVLMPTYQAEPYLGQSMDSILSQTFTCFEFIIIDDASTDATWGMLGEYARTDRRIVLLRNRENLGVARSLNRGLARVRGKYIARQDADDISLPERLSLQVEYMERHRRVVMLGTAFRLVEEGQSRSRIIRLPTSDSAIRWRHLFGNSFAHNSVMLRADVLRRHALRYDQRGDHVEDYELWRRLLRVGEGANLAEPLVVYRYHPQQVSRRFSDHQQFAARRIARANLRELGICVSDDRMRTLRDWAYRFPRRLSHQDMKLCFVIFRALRKLSRRGNFDPRVARTIRRYWISRILCTSLASPQVWLDLWSSGLMGAMLSHDARYVREYLSERLMHRLRLFLKPTLGPWVDPLAEDAKNELQRTMGSME